MKTKRIKTEYGYSSKPTDFVAIWNELLDYVQSYPYEIDKIIWVGELEHGTVSVFPGSREDVEDPDIPCAFVFDIPVFSSELDELSENDSAFEHTYNKQKRWLAKQIKSSWQKFRGRTALEAEGLEGAIGVYYAEFFDDLSPAALQYVCGTKLDFGLDNLDGMIETFCRKHDMLGREYCFPDVSRRRNIVYLNSRFRTDRALNELIDLVQNLPDRNTILLSWQNDNAFTDAGLEKLIETTGVKVRPIKTFEQDLAFLEYIESKRKD